MNEDLRVGLGVLDRGIDATARSGEVAAADFALGGDGAVSQRPRGR